ncbi:hypothetical protein CPB86DRAFT_780172 [Serendipita vermifera]|nr:hypothetical protein CPB86DRAFT_780172 [Serendipita vermifera]
MAEITNGDTNGNPQPERVTGKVTTQRPTRRGPAPQIDFWPVVIYLHLWVLSTECRRLKLRCNRQSPCATCLKRGVAERCSGATSSEVTTDPASMLLTAATSTICELQDRNKSLEAHIVELQQTILDVLHGDRSVTQPEHVLHAEIVELKKKNQVGACLDKSDMQKQMVESFGTLTISDGPDHTSWLGSTASSEFFLNAPGVGKDFSSHRIRMKCYEQGVPPELMLLGRIFIFSQTPDNASANIRSALRSAAPTKEIAKSLCDCFFLYGSWLSSPVSRDDFFQETFEPLYAAPTWTGFTYDRIALLFAVMAVGVLLDLQLQVKESWNFAYRFHKLAGGTLGMSEYIESPSITSCQTIAMICIFHLFCDDPDGPARCWATTGLLLRMAQSVYDIVSTIEDRNTSLLQQSQKESRRRPRLWWEIAFFDRMQSLFYGRPTGITRRQCDCPLPEPDPAEPTYDILKHKFIDECIAPIIDEALAVTPPSYITILKLDKRMRDFTIPDLPPADGSPGSHSLITTFQNYALHDYKEMALLHLHRSAFILALREHPNDPLKHKFAPSVLAVHKAACTVIINTKNLLKQYSTLVPRLYVWGLHAFSAAVLLAALVTRSPGCSLAQTALLKLDIVCTCFEHCRDNVRMSTALPLVMKFRAVARKAFASFTTGQDSTPTEQDEEELSILSGNSNLVYSMTRSQETSPEDGSEVTSNGDTSLYNKLLEHFKGVEWDQTHYQPSPEEMQSFAQHSIAQENGGMFNGNPAFKPGPAVQTSNGLEDFDYGIFNPLPALAPGQLPMPIDGVNYNFNVQQEQQSEDPLEFLSKQNPLPAFGQSWDYVAE